MVCFDSVDHSSTLLQSLFVSEKYSDLTICAGKTGKCWNVHKAILAESTKYFEVMLSSSFKEASDYKITIDDVDSDVLEATINFLYSGKIEIANADFAERLLKQAHLMQISDIIKYCFEYLDNNLTAENCIGFYLLAVKYEEKDMIKKFFQFAVDNFLKVVEFSEYLGMDFHALKLYLSNIIPSESVEEVKVRTVVKWIEDKPTVRGEYIGECIRELIDFKFVTNMMIFNKLVNICENQNDLQYLNKQQFRIHYPQILVICEKDQTNNSILNYNITKNKTYDLGEIPNNHTVLAVWDDKIVIATENLEDTRTIYVCDMDNVNIKQYTYTIQVSEKPKEAVTLDDIMYIMTSKGIYKLEIKSGVLELIRTVEDSDTCQSLAISQRKLYLALSNNNKIKLASFDVDGDEWKTISDYYDFGSARGSLIVNSNGLYYFNNYTHRCTLRQTVWKKTQTWNFTSTSAVCAGSEILFANQNNIYKYTENTSSYYGYNQAQASLNISRPIIKMLTI